METGAANFEEEFVKWSPYHIERNLYDGTYQVGSKIRFREIVMGLDYIVTGNAVNESLLGDSKNGSDRTSSVEGRFIPPSMLATTITEANTQGKLDGKYESAARGF